MNDEKYITRVLSRLIAENGEIVSIEKEDSSPQKVWKIVYNTPNNKKYTTIYLKKYCHNVSWWSFLDTNFTNRELLTYNLLNKNDILTPKIYGIESDGILLKGLQGIKGTTLAKKNPRKFLKKSAKVLAQIHKIKINQNSVNPITRNNLGNATLKNLIKLLSWIHPNIKFHIDFHKIMERPPVLLHGDFHENNLLFTKKGVMVLNMEEAAYGDPHLDIVNFCHTIIRLYPKESLAKLYMDFFLKIYEKYSGWKPTNIHFWSDILIFRNRHISTYTLLDNKHQNSKWNGLRTEFYDL